MPPTAAMKEPHLPSAVTSRLDSTLDYIHQWLQRQLWVSQVPGMQVAIGYGSSIRLSRSYGVTSLETGEPTTPHHLFRIASQSKTITATAILQLAEQGRLRLDDDLGTHITELAEAEAAIARATVRDVLAHAAGIVRDGWDADHHQLLKPAPDEAEVVRIAIEQGSVLKPGAALKYSNIGYDLLGLVVARASGLAYHEYVTRHVVQALELKNTGPDLDADRLNEFVHGHSGLHVHRERRVLPLVELRADAPCGGFYATAEDLVKYYSAHLPGDTRLLSEASKRQQQHPLWPAEPQSGRSYGLGVEQLVLEGRMLIGHNGRHPGGQTSSSYFDPVSGIVVCVLANAGDAPASDIARGVFSLLSLAAVDPCDPDGPGVNHVLLEGPLAELTGEEMAPFTGRFANAFQVWDVATVGGRLLQVDPGSADALARVARLVPSGADELTIVGGSGFSSPGERLRFVRTTTGQIDRVEGRGGATSWPLETYVRD